MNRACQDAITTEIMEIVGGAEALGSTKASSTRYIDLGDLVTAGQTPAQHGDN
jgi:hypothetical protein